MHCVWRKGGWLVPIPHDVCPPGGATRVGGEDGGRSQKPATRGGAEDVETGSCREEEGERGGGLVVAVVEHRALL